MLVNLKIFDVFLANYRKTFIHLYFLSLFQQTPGFKANFYKIHSAHLLAVPGWAFYHELPGLLFIPEHDDALHAPLVDHAVGYHWILCHDDVV